MNLKELLEKDPQLRQRWAADLNTLQPEQLNPRSHKKAWWRCEQGHTWQATVGSVAAEGCGCPYCAGKKAVPGVNDLRALHPDLAAQWHPTRNGTLNPSGLSPGSNKKIWWRCDEGHVWQAAVYSRTRKRAAGCPACAAAGRTKKYPKACFPPRASAAFPAAISAEDP